MPGENIQDWSTTAATNATADSSINWAEGMARATVNDSARSMMAAVAKDRNLHNGSITTGGTANAQTFSSGLTYTSVPTGLWVKLKIGATLTNTATATLNMDGIGAVTIKTAGGSALAGGELVAGSYANFLYNGTNWILVGATLVIVQTFTASGTYTPTPGMTYCVIEAVGCGGGGGSAAGGGAGTTGAAGGGGSGGYSRKTANAGTVGASQTVTIGSAGTAGTAGGNGGAGGDVSVGSLCIGKGGGGGLAFISGSQVPQGGVGGIAGTGDVTAAGSPGGPGYYNTTNATILAAAGNGGSSYFGGGARGVSVSASAGTAGSNYGSGGSGGCAHNTASTFDGGAGSAGFVVITEYVAC